jgi:hypothetical protein
MFLMFNSQVFPSYVTREFTCGYKTECPCQVAGEAGGEAGANGVEAAGMNKYDLE